MSFTAGKTRPSKFICGRRDVLTTGPGPDAGGSKPGKEGCDHMPEKSGMDAAPCARLVGPTAPPCPETAVAAVAANATMKRKSSRNIMIPSLPGSPIPIRMGNLIGLRDSLGKLEIAHDHSERIKRRRAQ